MAANLRRQALQIFRVALKAADPYHAVLRHFKLPRGRFQNIYVIGAGKATAEMARAIEKLLGARITGGEINVKDGHTALLRRIKLNECGHPIPDDRGVSGARRIAEIAQQAGPNDLVICLISGGASALLPLPARGVTLAEKQKITRLLLACGANIHEINCVRKHLSAIKGGHLAQLVYPATLLTLILS
ncbi:MAG TPA: glycerate-2-kinase family protein, partial [Bryobacteraceae bacterium]|nr:glycerate-2-kinase family protein [Bryobacteraceae bacterium]